MGAIYFRCVGPIRAVTGMARAGLCSCGCQHASRMGTWLCALFHQRPLSLQHPSYLVQIYLTFAVCCQRCNHLLAEKCFIAAYFCLCFSPNMQHTMETWCVRRGQVSGKDTQRQVLLYLLTTYTWLFLDGLQRRHMQLKISRAVRNKGTSCFCFNLLSLLFLQYTQCLNPSWLKTVLCFTSIILSF